MMARQLSRLFQVLELIVETSREEPTYVGWVALLLSPPARPAIRAVFADSRRGGGPSSKSAPTGGSNGRTKDRRYNGTGVAPDFSPATAAGWGGAEDLRFDRW